MANNHEKMWEELGLDVQLHNKVLSAIDRSFKATVATQQNRPEGMNYFDRVLHESHGGRIAELLTGKNQGHKIVGTFCIYVPEEIVMAAGLVPIALCGGTNFSVPYAEKTFPRDICPLVKSTLGLAFSKTCPYAPIKSLAVGETTCDAKKKTWDILSQKVNFHVMEVPQKKGRIDADLWRSEIYEFTKKIEETADKKVTAEELLNAVQTMNRKRRALQELNELRRHNPPPISGLDALVVMQAALNDEPERFTEKLTVLNQELKERVKKGFSPFVPGTRRIMIAGCPSVMGNWKIHHLIESSGAAVVIDETCTGQRYFNHLVEECPGDLARQLSALADRYMKINCSCFTPNNDRLTAVVQTGQAYQVQGVIQYILQYCHTYNVEAIRIEGALKNAGLPSIKIETDYSEEDTGQLRTRIEAFLEKIE